MWGLLLPRWALCLRRLPRFRLRVQLKQPIHRAASRGLHLHQLASQLLLSGICPSSFSSAVPTRDILVTSATVTGLVITISRALSRASGLVDAT